MGVRVQSVEAGCPLFLTVRPKEGCFSFFPSLGFSSCKMGEAAVPTLWSYPEEQMASGLDGVSPQYVSVVEMPH